MKRCVKQHRKKKEERRKRTGILIFLTYSHMLYNAIYIYIYDTLCKCIDLALALSFSFFFFKLKEETDSSLVSFGTNKQVRVKRGERKGGGSFQKFGQYTRHDSIRTLNHFIPPAIARLRGDKRNDFSLGNSFRLNCPLPPPTPLCPLGARIFPPLSTS